jgi:hypothetical protein
MSRAVGHCYQFHKHRACSTLFPRPYPVIAFLEAVEVASVKAIMDRRAPNQPEQTV